MINPFPSNLQKAGFILHFKYHSTAASKPFTSKWLAVPKDIFSSRIHSLSFFTPHIVYDSYKENNLTIDISVSACFLCRSVCIKVHFVRTEPISGGCYPKRLWCFFTYPNFRSWYYMCFKTISYVCKLWSKI